MKRLIALVSTVLFLGACSDSDSGTRPEEITVADLVGSWTASSLVFTNNANPAEEFDVIAAGGENRVTVLDGGRARTWIDFGTFSDEWDAQLSIAGSVLTSRPAETSRSVRSWTFTLEGNVLTLTDSSSEFDFTLANGTGVPATEVVTFVRQ